MAYIGSLPTDMTRRRPEEGKGEGRRWGGCHVGVRGEVKADLDVFQTTSYLEFTG